MKAGHSFTIEPMISEGDWRDEHWPDDWTGNVFFIAEILLILTFLISSCYL